MAEPPHLDGVPGPVEARPVHCAPGAPRPLELTAISRRDAVLDLLLFLVVGLLVPVGFELAAMATLTEAPEVPETQLLVIRKWFDALLVAVLAAYFVYRHRLRPAVFGLQAERLGMQVFWALPTLFGVYVVFLGMMAVVALLVLLVPQFQEDLNQRAEFMELLPLYDLRSTILLLIPVAIHEELLFRGLLIPFLRRVGCGWGLAVFLSTAIFASLHLAQGWLGVIQVFGVGAMLGVFFVLSRSLLAVIIAHFVFNLIQLQAARFLLPWIEKVTEAA